MKKSIIEDLNSFEQRNNFNRNMIKESLINQDSKIRSKLKARRERSINKSMEKSFSKMKNKSVIPGKKPEKQKETYIKQ